MGAVDLGLNGIVPADAQPMSPTGLRKVSLRKGPVKPPAPCQDDDEEPLATSGLSMAGSAAVSLRRSLRLQDNQLVSEPFASEKETLVPRPPSSRKPSRTGSRPQGQRISSASSCDRSSYDDNARLTGGSEGPTSARGPARPIRAFCHTASKSGDVRPLHPRPPEDTAPRLECDDDEWRLSNYSFRSSNLSAFGRAKSTPSRGRVNRTTSRGGSTANGGEEGGQAGAKAGVISPEGTTKLLRGGHRKQRESAGEEGSAAQERLTHGSRRTNTFTSRGTGTICSFDENGRATFNFGDRDQFADHDDEGMLAETIGDY